MSHGKQVEFYFFLYLETKKQKKGRESKDVKENCNQRKTTETINDSCHRHTHRENDNTTYLKRNRYYHQLEKSESHCQCGKSVYYHQHERRSSKYEQRNDCHYQKERSSNGYQNRMNDTQTCTSTYSHKKQKEIKLKTAEKGKPASLSSNERKRCYDDCGSECKRQQISSVVPIKQLSKASREPKKTKFGQGDRKRNKRDEQGHADIIGKQPPSFASIDDAIRQPLMAHMAKQK